MNMTDTYTELAQGKIALDESGYQEGAIVKKPLYQSETTNIIHVAFASGQEMKPHSSPMDAVLQILDGEGVIQIDGKDNIVKKGEMILLPANIPHGLKADVNFKVLITKIKV